MKEEVDRRKLSLLTGYEPGVSNRATIDPLDLEPRVHLPATPIIDLSRQTRLFIYRCT